MNVKLAFKFGTRSLELEIINGTYTAINKLLQAIEPVVYVGIFAYILQLMLELMKLYQY